MNNILGFSCSHGLSGCEYTWVSYVRAIVKMRD